MRAPVELAKCYRLLNHGPATLVTTAYAGQSNVMAASWVMPLDFDSPKVVVVIDKTTLTRELVDGSGCFALNVPPRALAQATLATGTTSGRSADKFITNKFSTFAASMINVPLIEGCVGWLECRVLSEPSVETKYDLFIGEVLAAWADASIFLNGRWRFEESSDRTIHYVAGGQFFATGEPFTVPVLP